jgi:hypothetical protein
MNLEVKDGFSGKKAGREKIDEKTLCGGDKQRSTKHTYKTKNQVIRTPLKTGMKSGALPKSKQFLLH